MAVDDPHRRVTLCHAHPTMLQLENHIDTGFIIQFVLSLLIELQPQFKFVIEPIIEAKKNAVHIYGTFQF